MRRRVTGNHSAGARVAPAERRLIRAESTARSSDGSWSASLRVVPSLMVAIDLAGEARPCRRARVVFDEERVVGEHRGQRFALGSHGHAGDAVQRQAVDVERPRGEVRGHLQWPLVVQHARLETAARERAELEAEAPVGGDVPEHGDGADRPGLRRPARAPRLAAHDGELRSRFRVGRVARRECGIRRRREPQVAPVGSGSVGARGRCGCEGGGAPGAGDERRCDPDRVGALSRPWQSHRYGFVVWQVTGDTVKPELLRHQARARNAPPVGSLNGFAAALECTADWNDPSLLR